MLARRRGLQRRSIKSPQRPTARISCSAVNKVIAECHPVARWAPPPLPSSSRSIKPDRAGQCERESTSLESVSLSLPATFPICYKCLFVLIWPKWSNKRAPDELVISSHLSVHLPGFLRVPVRTLSQRYFVRVSPSPSLPIKQDRAHLIRLVAGVAGVCPLSI